jgi:hypothetical protein
MFNKRHIVFLFVCSIALGQSLYYIVTLTFKARLPALTDEQRQQQQVQSNTSIKLIQVSFHWPETMRFSATT